MHACMHGNELERERERERERIKQGDAGGCMAFNYQRIEGHAVEFLRVGRLQLEADHINDPKSRKKYSRA